MRLSSGSLTSSVCEEAQRTVGRLTMSPGLPGVSSLWRPAWPVHDPSNHRKSLSFRVALITAGVLCRSQRRLKTLIHRTDSWNYWILRDPTRRTLLSRGSPAPCSTGDRHTFLRRLRKFLSSHDPRQIDTRASCSRQTDHVARRHDLCGSVRNLLCAQNRAPN